MKYFHITFAVFYFVSIVSCQNKPAVEKTIIETPVEVKEEPVVTESATDSRYISSDYEQRFGREPHPELPWYHNASIYEINTRQFSKEGTFAKVTEKLTKIYSTGVKVIWIMPIHPIGVENRKGGLGSPYSISDYKAINPEFGTLEDFKTLVQTAHDLGLKVIIDWVANHTAFDHVWAKDHLDYYTLKDGKQVVALDLDGNPTDWTDVADLNYENKDMRAAMIDAMKYWITECDIDGFRCDVAGFVPLDFWIEATTELEKTKKNLFWLAEWDDPKMHEAFKVTYGWAPHHIFNDVAQGKVGTEKIKENLEEEAKTFPEFAYRMYFTTNHDENSWNGTIKERMGQNGDAMTALAFTIGGMPLLYNGQEAGLDKRLAFFEKDEIDWSDTKKVRFYQKLLILKQTNKALWNGEFGGKAKVFLAEGKQFGFTRQRGPDAVLVLSNFDDKMVEVEINPQMMPMTDIFTRLQIDFSRAVKIRLQPHAYLVFVN
jgi:1,4-alpha-glucan branching enzyme